MKKNFFYSVIYQVLSLIIPIITTPYLARTLGVDSIGTFSYVHSIVAFFVILATLGTTTYGQRIIAYNRDSQSKLNEAFWNVLGIRIVVPLIILVLFWNIIFEIATNADIYLIMSLNILNVSFDISWFYQGIENFKKIVVRTLFVKFANLISIFLFVKDEKDLQIYTFFYCGYIVLGNIMTWIGIRKYISFPVKINLKNHFKGVLLLFVPTVAMQIYTVLDKAMLGWMAKSTYESGCYEQAEKISRIAVAVVATVASVAAPRIANLTNKIGNGEINSNAVRQLIYKCMRVLCMLACPITCGIVGVSSVFAPVFLGEGYEKVIVLLPIFGLLVLIVGFANVIGIAYLIPIGKQNVYTFAVVISAIVNLSLNLFLIPRFLSIGAACASVIAEFVGICVQFYYCIKYDKFDTKIILCSVWKYFCAAIFMMVGLVLLKCLFAVTLESLVLLIIFGICTYFVILLLLRDELIFVGLRNLLKNKNNLGREE